jgi:hypothetical protein
VIEPILQYILLALGLIASLCLFLSVKREIHIQARKHRRKIEEMGARLQTVAEQEPHHGISPLAPRSGFNLSRRAQAMRLLRRGEDVGHIAAALGVTDREVELLIRVQRLAAEHSIPTPPVPTQQ